MRQRIIPDLASMTQYRPTSDGFFQTKARGLAVLSSPQLNKGTAFTAEERIELGLTGLIPPAINTLATQAAHAYRQYEQLPDVLSRHVFLTSLRERNEVLFYRLLSSHLREMIPVAGELTAGMALERHHQGNRRPWGVYLSINHLDSIEEAFHNTGAEPGEIDLILATDAERIPGVGDWGVGGIEVLISKLAIYTAAGGVDPARTLPVMLDVGTNRGKLLDDPMYAGNRHTRVRGERYDAFMDAYVKAATKLFPKAVLQWEDFEAANGRRLTRKYQKRLCTFNDDMQGAGAITLAAAISAVRVCATPISSQRVVIFGAGAAGIGVADLLRDAMVAEGLPLKEATARFWCLDRSGLLTRGAANLRDHQAPYARPAAECKGWKRDNGHGGINLAEVIHRVRPTMLIGASAVPGSFTQAIVKEMAAGTERPIILVLSTPQARSEAHPADLISWTDGRALVATGSTFGPTTHKGVTYVVAEMNNAMLYPGLGLGVIVSGARRISSGMLAAAASAVSSLVTVRQPGSSLLPQIDDLRGISMTVAVAVAEAAHAEGLAKTKLGDIVEQVRNAMWRPEYRRIQAY